MSQTLQRTTVSDISHMKDQYYQEEIILIHLIWKSVHYNNSGELGI